MAVAEKQSIGMFFLDSGAHSLFNAHAKDLVGTKDKYKYFRTQGFRRYVDDYAAFIKQHADTIDYYANVDVIHNPELSWKVLKYLEQEHGLRPVPVLHMGTHISWLEKHLEAGYDYLGLGGVALRGGRSGYVAWADQMFERICQTPGRLPSVRVHGFAMTGYSALTRWPWWSVDSASWVKSAGAGTIYVPQMRNGRFTFASRPRAVAMSIGNEKQQKTGRLYKYEASTRRKGHHIDSLQGSDRTFVELWLQQFGLTIEQARTDYKARVKSNLNYFKQLCDSRPQWPWPLEKREPLGQFGLV